MVIFSLVSIGISLFLLLSLMWIYTNLKQWVKFALLLLLALAYIVSLLLFVNYAFRLFLSLLCIITTCYHIYRESHFLLGIKQNK